MARSGRISASTIAKFIAPDDSAIGGDVATIKDRYEQYIKTADHRVLELKAEEKPAFYYVRPQLYNERVMIRDYFAAITSEQETLNADGTAAVVVEGAAAPNPEALAEAVYKADPDGEKFEILRRAVVFECIIGCTDHPIVKDEVDDSGALVVEHVQWKVGTPEPVGFREELMKDSVLSTVLFQYLFTISNLSEKEKNS